MPIKLEKVTGRGGNRLYADYLATGLPDSTPSVQPREIGVVWYHFWSGVPDTVGSIEPVFWMAKPLVKLKKAVNGRRTYTEYELLQLIEFTTSLYAIHVSNRAVLEWVTKVQDNVDLPIETVSDGLDWIGLDSRDQGFVDAIEDFDVKIRAMMYSLGVPINYKTAIDNIFGLKELMRQDAQYFRMCLTGVVMIPLIGADGSNAFQTVNLVTTTASAIFAQFNTTFSRFPTDTLQAAADAQEANWFCIPSISDGKRKSSEEEFQLFSKNCIGCEELPSLTGNDPGIVPAIPDTAHIGEAIPVYIPRGGKPIPEWTLMGMHRLAYWSTSSNKFRPAVMACIGAVVSQNMKGQVGLRGNGTIVMSPSQPSYAVLMHQIENAGYYPFFGMLDTNHSPLTNMTIGCTTATDNCDIALLTGEQVDNQVEVQVFEWANNFSPKGQKERSKNPKDKDQQGAKKQDN